ncbi:hypothetical protein [Fluviicola sp.]|uniref:hypothetical protein n=1 Tax=Fluviicola sp. TaxID=1917219 RepID=UPI0031E390C9
MKWFFSLFILVFSSQLSAQQVVWEKVLGSNVADFDSRDAVTDSKGNTYIVGRYETGIAFFKTVNGQTVYADTTLPFGTSPFVWKISPDGKLLKRIFLPGIEAQHIVLLSDNRLAVCGFMNDYREKNYEQDRGQGVFSVFLDSTLEGSNYNIYPSFYNSTPFGMTFDSENGLIIAASAFTGPDPNIGLHDVYSLRLIRTNDQGATLRDTICLYPVWFTKSKYYARTFDGLGLAKGADDSFWLCGEVLGTEGGIHDARTSNPMALVQFDKDFRKMTAKVFTHRDRFRNEVGAYVNDLTASDKYVFVVGQDLHETPQSFVFLFNTKGDTIYKKGFNGDFGEEPVVAQIDESHWAVLNVSKADEFVISFFDLNGLVKEKRFKPRKYSKPKALIVHGKELIAVGKIKEGEIEKMWVSKLRLD